MTEYPALTRADLSAMLQSAETEHAKMAARLELAIKGLRLMARLYRNLRRQRGCCNGGEDAAP